MFNSPGKTTALPSPGEMAELETSECKKRLAIPAALYAKFNTPEYVREALDKLWDQELSHGTGKKYLVIMPVHESREGRVWLEASVKNAQAELYLSVGDPYAGKKARLDSLYFACEERQYPEGAGPAGPVTDKPEFVRVSAMDMPKLGEEELAWLDNVWKAFKPVNAIKAGKQTQPNAKCECGSGRKRKKCCGRFV